MGMAGTRAGRPRNRKTEAPAGPRPLHRARHAPRARRRPGRPRPTPLLRLLDQSQVKTLPVVVQSRSDDVLLGVGVSPRIMPPINYQPRSGVFPVPLPQCETQALLNLPRQRDALQSELDQLPPPIRDRKSQSRVRDEIRKPSASALGKLLLEISSRLQPAAPLREGVSPSVICRVTKTTPPYHTALCPTSLPVPLPAR